jgi:hypothetical protein
MRNIIMLLFSLFVLILYFPSSCFSQQGDGLPLKYISSCEIDLNNDNKTDIVLLVDTYNGRELIVLLKIDGGYRAFLLSNDKPNVHLSCHYDRFIQETSAGKGKKNGKVYETNGTYIKLFQPESSSIVFFWDKNSFKEVWTSD